MFEYKNDLLIVDELIYDPAYPTDVVIRIDGEYYMINTAEARNRPIKNIRPYKKPVCNNWYRGTYDWQFLSNGLIPRDGFKVNIGRAITAEELREIVERYGLTDAEISKEFDDMIGGIYGEEFAKTFKAIQVKVPANEAISLEDELKAKGIQAGNVAPGRVNIRTGWGGRREGAGRPATGRKKRNFYITDEEYQKLMEYLETLRK
jgi:hypothetical protein